MLSDDARVTEKAAAARDPGPACPGPACPGATLPRPDSPSRMPASHTYPVSPS